LAQPKLRYNIGQSQEVGQSAETQIALDDVDSVEGAPEQVRRQTESVHHDDEGNDQEDDRADETGTPVGDTLQSREQRPCEDAHREQKLPGEGIEEPPARLGPARQGEHIGTSERVNSDGDGSRQHHMNPHQDHGYGSPEHEGDVEGKDVEVAELMPEQKNTRDAAGRIVENRTPTMSLEHADIVTDHIADGEQRYGHTRHDQVHAIKFKRSPEASSHDTDNAALGEFRIIDESNRQAGDEDESLCRIREAVIARGQVLENVARDMIDKDDDEDEPAPEID
jgi:hypothetical protein